MRSDSGINWRRILYIILVIILIFLVIKLYNNYKRNNLNDFVQSEYKLYTSKFSRDNEVKYSDKDSYKIESETNNDAMFYKTVEVVPNTPYKVTCMVKTENVKTEKEVSNGGAHISIGESIEKSKSVTGTTDWQKIELIFNSKKRTSVNIGFRLGGYDDNCTGTAWFSDFTLEKGSPSTDSNWNFACFIFENTDVVMDGKRVNISMTDTDISDMKQNMSRFKKACEELSKNKMTVSYDIIQVKTPITSLSYDTANGYFVAYENVASTIESVLDEKDYDHIFVCVRLGNDAHTKDIPVYDWIGLGGMEYLGVGFSNIRLPNEGSSYAYKYNANINTFPEEVFLHEFLHTLERNAQEYGYERPELHNYAQYGYESENLDGLKKWYRDYMNGTIKTSNGYVGLPPEVFSLKPNHEKDFEFSYKIDEFKEPQNIFEEIKAIITKAVKNVNYITTMKKEENVV